jgi:hypothetical protein
LHAHVHVVEVERSFALENICVAHDIS